MFKLGAFNPQMVDQALMMLDMMEFDGKDELMQKIAQNGTMFQKLMHYMQLAFVYAQKLDPAMAQQIGQDLMGIMGGGGGAMMGGSTKMFESDHIAGVGKKEPTIVANSRERAAGASQPDSGKLTKGDKK